MSINAGALWSLYFLVCRQLGDLAPDRFRALPDHPDLTSSHGNTWFSTNPDNHRVALDVGKGLYAEANLSATDICKRIGRLLDIFGIDRNELRIYLREDRDAKEIP